jgi:hypothetical protein
VVKESNIFYSVKKDLFGCFRIEEACNKDNETGLKKGGGIEMSIAVLPLRDARSLSLEILTLLIPIVVGNFEMSKFIL